VLAHRLRQLLLAGLAAPGFDGGEPCFRRRRLLAELLDPLDCLLPTVGGAGGLF
jgi:hypothetical protein